MAAPKAPLLDPAGKAAKDVSLEEAVFAVELKPHLVHEAVRAELNAQRQGTRAAKSRGLVSGGRAKPWRQKGTGRARQGTIRAPQFTGGGVAFAPTPRSFDLKVNKKALKAALRCALSDHAQAGTIGVLDAAAFASRRRRPRPRCSRSGARSTPTVVVALEDEANRRQELPQPRPRGRHDAVGARGRSTSCGRARCSSARPRWPWSRGGHSEPASGRGPDRARSSPRRATARSR